MADRTRTHGWTDALALRDSIAGRSGLEVLELMARGDLAQPPIADTLAFRLTEVERGRAVFECEPAEFHYNVIGTAHAGLAVTLMDSAMGCAFVTVQDEGAAWTTLELKANFTRAITIETGLVRCVGTVIHAGRRVATTDARVEDAQGRLYAHATSTILVLDG